MKLAMTANETNWIALIGLIVAIGAAVVTLSQAAEVAKLGELVEQVRPLIQLMHALEGEGDVWSS